MDPLTDIMQYKKEKNTHKIPKIYKIMLPFMGRKYLVISNLNPLTQGTKEDKIREVVCRPTSRFLTTITFMNMS